MTARRTELAPGPDWAPYMVWAKHRPAARYDLAGSNLLPCRIEDLPGCRDVVELYGLNPDGYPPLLEAIAARYGVTTAQVAPGAGAAGANFLAMAATIRPGDTALVERPAYDPLLGTLRLLGARIQRFDRVFDEGYGIDPDRVRRALTPDTRLIVLSSPHNPSGALVMTDVLQEIGRMAEDVGAHVLVDEVYLDGVYVERPPPAATLGDVFISTNSLTKAYGLSGLRSGWVLASPTLVERMNRVRDVVDGTGSFPSDTLAAFAFAHLDKLEARARSILEPNLQRLARFIESQPALQWVRPAGGNVAFPRLKGIDDTAPFAEKLLREHQTAVVPGAFFEEPAHMRIAFSCSAEILEGGLAGLAAALA